MIQSILQLPTIFEDLECHLEWALSTERERHNKRLSSDMKDIESFYRVMLARTPEIVEHLNQFDLGKIPDESKPLLYMCLSFAEVANAVELFKQPSVPLGFDPNRFIPIE